MRLHVRVTDDFVLDAGVSEVVSGEVIIHPPEVTLFRQVVGYLRSKPDALVSKTGFGVEEEGAAAAAVTLRWGSYLAVLADRDKPIWNEVKSSGVSRISNGEMARINIEASAALAEWIDLRREDRRTYDQLAARALLHLPMSRRQARPQGSHFVILAMPEAREKLIAAVPRPHLAKVRADAETHASRLFANALINTAWRNGPVEDIHGGEFRGYPLDRRRMTVAEERTVMRSAVDHFATGMDVCQQLSIERPARSWSEQVLPYALAEMLLITPSRWTLTEVTREVRLPRTPLGRET